MTAEVVIMNKAAIALAADSAVTIATGGTNQKIYNTVNKLFTLSKYHPVGVMVNGNAAFMGVPWETIIKIYRKELKDTKFNHLHEYAEHFLSFIKNNNLLFPEAEQIKHIRNNVIELFFYVIAEIDKRVKSFIDANNCLEESNHRQIISEIISSIYEKWDKAAELPHVQSGDLDSLNNVLEPVFEEEWERNLSKLPIPEESITQLKQVVVFSYVKTIFPPQCSGVIIAGFGENDIFPALISYEIASIVGSFVKFRQTNNLSINHEVGASIIPFAQGEMVATFMEGINPELKTYFETYFGEMFRKYPDVIDNLLGALKSEERIEIVSKIREANELILTKTKKDVSSFIRQKSVDPVIGIVQVLPKDELAAMAESLVNLTSFKRKISMDAETVGGPVDVAVISKGDGFIWIKRKHYFKPELNPHFKSGYYR